MWHWCVPPRVFVSYNGACIPELIVLVCLVKSERKVREDRSIRDTLFPSQRSQAQRLVVCKISYQGKTSMSSIYP